MAEQVPSCYLIIGNGEDSNALHNPGYDFNDDAIVYGGAARVTEQEVGVRAMPAKLGCLIGKSYPNRT